MRPTRVSDKDIERFVSIVLGAGVISAAAVVLAGGIYYLARHGGDSVAYSKFHSEPSVDRRFHEIVTGCFALRPRSVIQFGLLLLIATPIVRVAGSLVGFALERDHIYVAITAIVLAVLLYSLITGAIAG